MMIMTMMNVVMMTILLTTYTADIAIVDKENDHKDEESEDEEGDNSAAKEQQVMVRNQRQRSSVSSTSGRIETFLPVPVGTVKQVQVTILRVCGRKERLGEGEVFSNSVKSSG
jgi:hypothetical protein